VCVFVHTSASQACRQLRKQWQAHGGEQVASKLEKATCVPVSLTSTKTLFVSTNSDGTSFHANTDILTPDKC